MSHDKTIDQLDRLRAVNSDAESGFRTAAEVVKNSELDSLFVGYAERHAKFRNELENEIVRLGGDVADSATIGGSLHKGWLEVKAALSGHSAPAVLKSCESSEEAAEIAYADASDRIATGQTHTLISKHCQQIKEIRTHLARLVGETKDGVEFQQNE